MKKFIILFLSFCFLFPHCTEQKRTDLLDKDPIVSRSDFQSFSPEKRVDVYKKLSNRKKRSLWLSKLNQVLEEEINKEQKNAVSSLISILTEDLFEEILTDNLIYENRKISQWLEVHAAAFNVFEGKLIFGTLNDYQPYKINSLVKGAPASEIISFKEFMQRDYEITLARLPENQNNLLQNTKPNNPDMVVPRYNYCDDPCDCSCSCRWGTYCIGSDSCFEKCGDCGAGIGCGFIWAQTCVGLCNDEGPTG